MVKVKNMPVKKDEKKANVKNKNFNSKNAKGMNVKAKNAVNKQVLKDNQPKKAKKNKEDEFDDNLYFFALGGLEHIGQNMYVYKFRGKYLVVDCGMGFLETEIGAGDVKYCDTTWLEAHRDDVLGFVMTHGHEDHIGALKHIWPKFRKPIYTTRFPGEILRRTFAADEINVNMGKDLIIFDHHGATFDIGCFNIETFHVSHSIPEAQMLIIKTDAGKVLHTGDWTFNEGITIEDPTNYARLREIGSDPKLLACVCDSTSTDRQAPQVKETEVRDALTEIMKNAPGRVFVTGYSRSLARIKMFSEAAKAAGRVAAIKERSNPRPVPYVGLPEFRQIGVEFGYLKADDTYLFSEVKDLPAEKQAVFLTGSQGEKFAMLPRLCRGHVKELQLQPTDTIVFSAIIIPGREQDVSTMYNQLAKMGIKTHTIFDTHNLHASGHAGRPEYEKFYDMVHPQVSIPMHGSFITEMLNGKMAMERGGAKYMMVVKNGDIIALKDGQAPYVTESIPTGFVVMEGETERSLDDQVYKNRKKIAISGAVFATLPVDKRGFLKGVPEVSTIGLFESDTTGYMKKQIQIEIAREIDGLSKNERKNQENLIRAVQIAGNKVVRPQLGDDKKPKYSVHFIMK